MDNPTRSPEPKNFEHPQTERKPRNKDSKRLLDIAVLFGLPAVFMLLSNGLEFGQSLTVIAGLMLVGYGAIFYFFPDLSEERSHSPKSHPPQPLKIPWVDYASLLSLPVVVVALLLYLVWTHTVLGKVGLAVATLAIPLAVVLLSWFVIRHKEHQVKKTGKSDPGMLLGIGLIALWIAAVFIFVVCLVSWIQKFALQW